MIFNTPSALCNKRARLDRRHRSVGGGSDLLGLVKERIVTPDVLVNLKTIKGLDQVKTSNARRKHRRAHHPRHAEPYRPHPPPLHGTGRSRRNSGTPQVRNVGTLAGNVCQRPWCWYFRNGFPSIKMAEHLLFCRRENQFHAIFGGGPSYIVHPSDTAPVALLALDATVSNRGPSGERIVPAADFFALPQQNPARENVLAADEALAEVQIPGGARGNA